MLSWIPANASEHLKLMQLAAWHLLAKPMINGIGYVELKQLKK